MDEPQLLFFQLPHSLPLRRQADLVAEADTDTNVDVRAKSEGGTRKRKQYPNHGCKLRELPGGVVGKMLVYKSGKVKMKLGDAHFDVSSEK
jgi:DNA-directed RNA polymerase III subunit RPC4